MGEAWNPEGRGRCGARGMPNPVSGCDGTRPLCELPAGHPGWHREGVTEWNREARFDVEVEDRLRRLFQAALDGDRCVLMNHEAALADARQQADVWRARAFQAGWTEDPP